MLQANITRRSPARQTFDSLPGIHWERGAGLRKFPQYQAINWRGVPLGRSQYHALEALLERRFSRGLQGRVGYTFSKLQTRFRGWAWQRRRQRRYPDPANPLVWGVSDDDTPHVLLTGFTWEVPGRRRESRSKSWALERQRHHALRKRPPLSITMNNDLGGLIFNNQKRPNKTGTEGKADFGDFDPFNDRYFNNAAWADPGPLQFGDAPKRDGDVRGFPNYTNDINIFKVFPIGADKRLRFEAQFGNVFDLTVYCGPNTNWSSPAFGQVCTRAYAASIQSLPVRYWLTNPGA